MSGMANFNNSFKILATKGPSINDVTHLGGQTFVTMCDEGGGGLRKCDVTFLTNIIIII